MFNLIDRYIARQVIVPGVLILFLLSCLRALFTLLDELGSLGNGTYQLSDALLFVGLMLPSYIIEFFPMSALIGALAGLGNMAAASELTVLRGAGMTTWRIAGSTIKASLILMIVILIVGEGIAPSSSKAAQQLRTSAISGGDLSFSRTGLWAKREGEIIQIGNVLSDGQLRDITLFEISPDNKLATLLKADAASNNNGTWMLTGVIETRFLENKVETVKQESRVWLSPLAQSQIETLTLEPDNLNLLGIIDYLDYLHQNGLEAGEFELALWRKLLQPLAIAVMMFLAASFVFGPMRNVSMGARVLSGVLLGFAFYLANQSFGPISLVFNTWPVFGAITPLLIFTLVGYFLMKKTH